MRPLVAAVPHREGLTVAETMTPGTEVGYVCEVNGCRLDPLLASEYDPAHDPIRYCGTHLDARVNVMVAIQR
jgi:hypothetical protein